MIRIALLAAIAASLSVPAFAQSDDAPTPAQMQARAAAEVRSGAQALVDAVDVCEAWMTTAEDNGLDPLTPYQQAVHDAGAEISEAFVDAQTHAIADNPASLALNGALDVWIDEGHAGCALNASASGARNTDLNRLRPEVVALLSGEDSGWALEDGVWVRWDGWSLVIGDDTAEPQVWGVERAR